MDIPPIIASSIRSKDDADFSLMVVFASVKSKIGAKVANKAEFRVGCSVRTLIGRGEVNALLRNKQDANSVRIIGTIATIINSLVSDVQLWL